MEEDGEQSHIDEQQLAAPTADDADVQTAAADDDNSNDDNPASPTAADGNNDPAQPQSQAARWRRAGVLTVALPAISSYSRLTSVAQFPQLLSFLRTFRASLGLTAFSTRDLLTALTVPSSSPFHVDVVWGLLWSPTTCPFSLRKHKVAHVRTHPFSTHTRTHWTETDARLSMLRCCLFAVAAGPLAVLR